MHFIGKRYQWLCKELKPPLFWGVTVQGRTFLKFLFFQVFCTLFFLICFLGLVKAWKHDLFLYALMTYLLWVLLFWPKVETFFFVSSFPLCWVFPLREFARDSSTTFLFHFTTCFSSKELVILMGKIWEKNSLC